MYKNKHKLYLLFISAITILIQQFVLYKSEIYYQQICCNDFKSYILMKNSNICYSLKSIRNSRDLNISYFFQKTTQSFY